MKNLNVVIGVLVGAVIGFAVRSQMSPSTEAARPTAQQQQAQQKAPPPPDSTVYKVGLGGAPIQGAADAKITIVEWSDFECPFCGRVIDTVKQIEKTYGSDVRIAFRHNPLPMHPNAPYAAKAAIAAQKQGKFWEMHDKLFEANNSRQPGALAKDKVDAMAQALGLDMTAFRTDVASPETQAVIDADQAAARQVGANGTPSFFVNGARISGAQPFENFKAVIDAQLKRANAELAKGTPKDKLYEALVKDGITPPPPAAQQAPAAQAKKVELDESAPSLGSKNAKVTMVLWSDFQCPFCSRVEPTLKQIRDTYKDDVRLVWRNQPLSFHPNAMPAAKAAMAAHKQGKFWEMHDKMFANQPQLSDANYEKWAKELGLNVAKWKADKDSPEIAALIQKDMSAGTALGADGTPTFFVNGKLISGALPFDAFKTVIDEQLKLADEQLKKGVKREKLYEIVMAENVKSAGTPAAAPTAAADSGAPVKVDLGNAPVLGDAKAPVTVVIFSDFQCPFCSRVEPTLAQLRKDYGKKVKFVWKNQPLPFHPQAMPAAEAAMAANEQGKFWEFHDKLFANQQQLGPELYEQTAKELGLDLAKWKASVESGKHKAAIQADSAQGTSLGANGTPTFFINGRKLVGAMPVDSFKQIIDAELGAAVAKK